MFVHTGPSGKRAGIVKPFEKLSNEQLKKELRARGCYDFDGKKKYLTDALKETLKGVRVPSLLLTNPSQSLHELNLQNYTILDGEPLHDVKGHLSNLFDELPQLLEKSLAEMLQQFSMYTYTLRNKKRRRFSCGRCTHPSSFKTKGKHTSTIVLKLIETAVDISEIMYADEVKRSPKSILRLYNSTWLHFKLCSQLLSLQ